MGTILIIDDDADLRGLLRLVLERNGHSVEESATLAEADNLIGSRAMDALIVDGMLPDGLGIDWIGRFRKAGERTPIAFLSAWWKDLETFSQLTDELGVGLVMYKPVDANEFGAAFERFLAASGPGGAGVSAPDGGSPDGATGSAGSEGADEIAEELELLRREFAASLDAKIRELSSAVSAARGSEGLLDSARSFAHRLRGSAGTFGFPEVSEACGRLEDLLSGAQGPTGRSGAFSWDDIRSTLLDVRLAASSQIASMSEPPARGRASVLVVDDDPAFLAWMGGVAARTVVPIVMARTAEEAVSVARRGGLSGAVLDVNLAEGRAFRLAARLRQLQGNSSLPVAFTSADRSIETRVAAVEAGAERYLEKPVTEESFAAVVAAFESSARERRGRVLVVDDDDRLARCYSAWLRSEGYEVATLHSASGLIETLEQNPSDVLLLDVQLPGMSGLDVCRALRASEKWELLPILMITASADPRVRLEAFRAGAFDFVSKPVLREELVARVGVQTERLQLIRERHDRDALSGLLLRRPFLEAFRRILAQSGRDGREVSVVLLDIDRFKQINDTRGHVTGDRVIAELGALLRGRFRTEDLRARWGGEEFILVFPGMSIERAQEVMVAALSDFSSMSFRDDAGETFRVSFTAGISSYPADGRIAGDLVRVADERLYSGKSRGRSRVQSTASVPVLPRSQKETR